MEKSDKTYAATAAAVGEKKTFTYSLEAGHPFQLSKIVAMRNTPNCQCQEQKGKGQTKKGIWNRFVSPILVLYLLSFLFILILVVHNFNKDNKRELLASKRQMNRLYV